MSRPKINFKIKFPEAKSPVTDGICGSSWNSQVEVKVPYKGMSKYTSILPILQEAGPFPMKQSEDFKSYVPDIEKAMPELLKPSLQQNIKKGIDGAKAILDNYYQAGYIQKDNRNSIQAMIDRAKKYLNFVKSLIEYWDGYKSDFKSPTGWPLDQPTFANCGNKIYPQKSSMYAMTKSGAGIVDFFCPRKDVDIAWHKEDQKLVFELLKASIEWARCAQELASATGIFFRNKEAYNESLTLKSTLIAKKPVVVSVIPGLKKVPAGSLQTVPDLGFQAVPGLETGPGLGAAADAEEELDLPEPEPPTVPKIEEEKAIAPKKKKKDNTLLLAGAAALGILIMKGK